MPGLQTSPTAVKTHYQARTPSHNRSIEHLAELESSEAIDNLQTTLSGIAAFDWTVFGREYLLMLDGKDWSLEILSAASFPETIKSLTELSNASSNVAVVGISFACPNKLQTMSLSQLFCLCCSHLKPAFWIGADVEKAFEMKLQKVTLSLS